MNESSYMKLSTRHLGFNQTEKLQNDKKEIIYQQKEDDDGDSHYFADQSLPSEPDSFLDAGQDCPQFYNLNGDIKAQGIPYQLFSTKDQQLAYFKNQYNRMNAINLAIIDAIKTTFSENVGKALEQYMSEKAPFLQLTQKNPIESSPSSFRCRDIEGTLLSFPSEQFSHAESVEMSRKFQDIINLGVTDLEDTIRSKKDSRINRKNRSKAKKKQTLSSSKKYGQHDQYDSQRRSPNQKRNVSLYTSSLFALTPSNQRSNNSHSNSSSKQPNESSGHSQIEELQLFKKRKNISTTHFQNIDYSCIDADALCKKSQIRYSPSSSPQTSTGQISTNRSKASCVIKEKSPQNTVKVVMNLLECQICFQCFSPNEFFRHVQYCDPRCLSQRKSNSHLSNKAQKSELNSISKPSSYCNSLLSPSEDFSFQQKNTPSTFSEPVEMISKDKMMNFTLMMKNLLNMKEQIETQIGILGKSKQQIQRVKLKQKLQKELKKVTAIIKEKENHMLDTISLKLSGKSKVQQKENSYMTGQFRPDLKRSVNKSVISKKQAPNLPSLPHKINKRSKQNSRKVLY